ncbi:UDP-glucose dehydrogenase family protein [Fictibacillus sp. KU28468]|uniref:UDP-glucose dehydrogenase family protein n=1 Tax=Fictibacillus sp. KU28468 TaxID=2991053 RepID=UPI00223E6667|nr:UDP-glucose/GDP-mannose dehydrogenase family protein [Fictibacillus sp. KU28468]UZJ79348.1 UDP-glucose/GDP-mannose dehydrogenase family protein [Fictibacillus sp. KU28468]
MRISVVGTGYVGLVTGVALSHIGHTVTCIDIDEEKVSQMNSGKSPIYEPGLEELMVENINQGRLFFSTNHQEGFEGSKVIYIAVGTPEKSDGSADLSFIEQVAKDIAHNIKEDVIVVTKSTVPVGTNHYIKDLINQHLARNVKVEVVSNPEFLREGSSVYDTFNGDRIVVGADSEEAAQVIKKINEPFGIPVYVTDVQSAEMIKYASNAFLATKISFINEIGKICEKLGADIESVAYGMGLDKRIGSMFLNAGIGYGGSCFPKDTKALTQIASNIDHQFELLESVIKVNNNQQRLLIEKAKARFRSLKGKRVALLGLSFKPNTDDMREAASIVICKKLLEEEAQVIAYDPIAVSNARKIIGDQVQYTENLYEALENSNLAFIVTEWNEIKELPLNIYEETMKFPVIFDGRNCYDPKEVEKYNIEYHSVGRKSVQAKPRVAAIQ